MKKLHKAPDYAEIVLLLILIAVLIYSTVSIAYSTGETRGRAAAAQQFKDEVEEVSEQYIEAKKEVIINEEVIATQQELIKVQSSKIKEQEIELQTLKVLLKEKSTASRGSFDRRRFVVSYYSPFDDKNDINTDGDIYTSTGTIPEPGTMAVDPKVIPYGSKITIVYDDGTVEHGTAEDCGGVIKGCRIDAFRYTYNEAIKLGMRNATVYWEVP